MFVLDSDHCVAILRGRLDVSEHIGAADPLGVTAITAAELIHGARRSARPERNLQAVHELLELLQVLPFGRAAAEQFGQIKAYLEARGSPLPDLDLLIASTVLAAGGVLVTHNSRHFRGIPGLTTADWLR